MIPLGPYSKSTSFGAPCKGEVVIFAITIRTEDEVGIGRISGDLILMVGGISL
jgi:hypothetical protein